MPFIYNKLFETLKKRNITIYRLKKDKIIGAATVEKMKKGEGHIDTRSLESLCRYLGCQLDEIMEYIPDESD